DPVRPGAVRASRASGAALAVVYAALAAYLPVSRLLPPGHSTRTAIDAYVPLVPWLGPLYVAGMVPIALLPWFIWARLPRREFLRYAAAISGGALLTYVVYAAYPTEIHRPPLPGDPLARWCLGLAYAARSPRGI